MSGCSLSMGFQMNECGKVRAGVVAVDPLRSLGLQTILQEALNLEAVEMTLQEALLDHDLGVLLVEADDAGEDIVDVVVRLRSQRPELKLVVVGQAVDQDRMQKLIGAGAKAYLTQAVSESELRTAMEVVLDGSIWAPRKLLARLIDTAGTAEAPAGKQADKLLDIITPREREVLLLLTEGHSNREIATALEIDEVTVKAHLGRMLRKAGASNRVELTLRAMEEQGRSFSMKRRT